MQHLIMFCLLAVSTLWTTFPVFASPDLTMTEFMRSPIGGVGGTTVTPPPIQAGSTVLVTGSMQNIGNGASIGTQIRFYLSTDVAHSAEDIQLGTMNGTPLAVNVIQFIIEQSLTIPANVAAGNYYILCYVDASNAIFEDNENNNIFGFPISIDQATSKPIRATVAPNMTAKNSTFFEGFNFGK